MPQNQTPIPPAAAACLVLADGSVFSGEGIGAESMTLGEICFNTAMTGYQEVLTDPSYCGQIITFTFPHIGNTGCNDEDVEAEKPCAAGLVLRERPTLPSNFRSTLSLDDWLIRNHMSGICGVDTRALTRHIRKAGAQNAAIVPGSWLVACGSWDKGMQEIRDQLARMPSMKGLELAGKVTTREPYEWNEPLWRLSPATSHQPPATSYHVVAIDYGNKLNILRSLAERGCRITVLPAKSSAEDILRLKPDGIFLSNGPGDPEATGAYALPVIRKLIDSGIPIFGICLGHQLLGLALGGKTEKMAQGHRGANHPVKDLKSGKVIITSQNHGFAVSKNGLPGDVEVTQISLFDGTVQGLRHKTRPIFCVQSHPEASPGPHDSQYLFEEFASLMAAKTQKKKGAA